MVAKEGARIWSSALLIFVFIMCSVLGVRGQLEKILSELLHGCVWMLTDCTCHISFLDRLILTFYTSKRSPLSQCLRVPKKTPCVPTLNKRIKIKRERKGHSIAKQCQRIWIFSMSPCCLLEPLFFHHWDVLVCNSVLSRSCVALLYPYLLVHEIKIHVQPRRHRRSPLHLRKASNWCPWNDLKILTLSPKFRFTQCIQIEILPSCWFCLHNYTLGLGHPGCFLAVKGEKHFVFTLPSDSEIYSIISVPLVW